MYQEIQDDRSAAKMRDAMLGDGREDALRGNGSKAHAGAAQRRE